MTSESEIKIGIASGLWQRALTPAGSCGCDGDAVHAAADALVAVLLAEYNLTLERIYEEFRKVHPRYWPENPARFGHNLAWRCTALMRGYTIGDGPKTIDDRLPGFDIRIVPGWNGDRKSSHLEWKATGRTANRWMSLDEHNRRAKAIRDALSVGDPDEDD